MKRRDCDALVLFGATGDLCYRKIFPALYHLVRRRLLVRVLVVMVVVSHGKPLSTDSGVPGEASPFGTNHTQTAHDAQVAIPLRRRRCAQPVSGRRSARRGWPARPVAPGTGR